MGLEEQFHPCHFHSVGMRDSKAGEEEEEDGTAARFSNCVLLWRASMSRFGSGAVLKCLCSCIHVICS